jgi:hypothetical protein
MAAKTISATRHNPIPSAGAIVALAAMVSGCQTDYASLAYAQEAHARQIAAWCYNNLGLTTASLEGQDCVRRAWVQIPDTDCQVLYGNNSCTTGYWPSYGPIAGARYARRRPIEK